MTKWKSKCWVQSSKKEKNIKLEKEQSGDFPFFDPRSSNCTDL